MDRAQDSERDWIQNLLQGGLALSMLLMLAGVILKLVSGDLSAPSTKLDSFLMGDISWGDRAMGLGIVVLAFTPAFRVLTLLFLWIRERDWRFAIVAAIVLVLLIISISLGGG